ncbi:MAG: DNA/RNA non-specific endonuclease, partial [Opitutaceae bacterium]
MFRPSCLLLALLLATVPVRGTIGEALQLQLGNPSGATADPANQTRYLIRRAQYGLDYNNTTHEPNWVSWNLTAGDSGASGRGDFATDTSLPNGFRRVTPGDYTNSGFDRGHMCPSADRTMTETDNQVTFLMSNIIPQTPDQNQGVWANFESYCRALANIGHELLIVSGPGGFGGTAIASGVAIPGFAWKIVVAVPVGPGAAATRITAATRVIALKIPNIAG